MGAVVVLFVMVGGMFVVFASVFNVFDVLKELLDDSWCPLWFVVSVWCGGSVRAKKF